MIRRDKLILQFIMIVALATFLFGVWAIIAGLRKRPVESPQSSSVRTNATPSPSAPN